MTLTLQFLDIESAFHTELNSVSDLGLLEEWPRGWLSGKAFFGGQIFVVDDSNFSGDYPILGFARQLRIIARNLNEHGLPGWYGDPGLEKPSTTWFHRDGEMALITEVNRSNEERLYSASIPLLELLARSEAYLTEVFEHCCRLVPRLKNRPEVDRWLADYSDDGKRPFSNLG